MYTNIIKLKAVIAQGHKRATVSTTIVGSIPTRWNAIFNLYVYVIKIEQLFTAVVPYTSLGYFHLVMRAEPQVRASLITMIIMNAKPMLKLFLTNEWIIFINKLASGTW